MAHLFAIVQANDVPTLDFSATPVAGYVHCGQAGGFAGYLFSGTAAQLAALNALPEVIGLVAMTDDGQTKWAELDNTIGAGARTKMNNWLTARGYPNIPAGWTYRQVLNAVFTRLNPQFNMDNFWVKE